MLRYFPSRKVFVVGVLAIGLLAWSIVHARTSQQVSTSISESILRSVAQAESTFPDFDNDGLYDWEEDLYGTDSENEDSDGNGVLDGDQYAAGEKSLGPRLSDSVYAALNRVGEESQNVPNPTDLLSTNPIIYENPYTPRDVQHTDDTLENHNAYLTVAFGILSSHVEVLQAEPTQLVEEWLQTKNPETLEEILELSQKTKEIAYALMKINVPEHYTDLHLDLTNNLFLSALSLEDVNKSINDPMAGFFAMANYINYQSKLFNVALEITTLYEEVTTEENNE